MEQCRTYGKAPYTVALVHGGPGAAGEMAPVAQALSCAWGVLEPLQTARSLRGQVDELKDVLTTHAKIPVVLVGFSWGAWLSFICAAEYPGIVRKLILIGSGSFDERYTTQLEQTRLSRLNAGERDELKTLTAVLDDPVAPDKSKAFARFGALMEKADAYDPLPPEAQPLTPSFDVFQRVWKEAADLRRSGRLLLLGRAIRCPVTAIHGDVDPHPVDGVRLPLSGVLRDFRFILLEKCGHKPWIERQARDTFFAAMMDELRSAH